jgi:hypothetical protein
VASVIFASMASPKLGLKGRYAGDARKLQSLKFGTNVQILRRGAKMNWRDRGIVNGSRCSERKPSMTGVYTVQDILSQYVPATDERDGDAQANLLADNGTTSLFGRSGTEKHQLAGEPASGTDVPAPHHHRPPHQVQVAERR